MAEIFILVLNQGPLISSIWCQGIIRLGIKLSFLISRKFPWVWYQAKSDELAQCPGKTHVVVIFFWKLIQHPPLLVWGMMYESKLTGMERYVYRKNFGPKIALKNDGGHSWALHWLDSTYLLVCGHIVMHYHYLLLFIFSL